MKTLEHVLYCSNYYNIAIDATEKSQFLLKLSFRLSIVLLDPIRPILCN